MCYILQNIASKSPSETTDWSADVYCQNVNNQQHGQLSYLYQTERRGKKASCQRDRERECVCKRWRVTENGGSISCKNGRWRNGPIWDKLGSRWKDYFNCKKLF